VDGGSATEVTADRLSVRRRGGGAIARGRVVRVRGEVGAACDTGRDTRMRRVSARVGRPSPEPAPGEAVARPPSGGSGMIMQVRGGNDRHIRHADVLARWPVIAESWARRVEAARESGATW
jgi:hypothetical protein